MRYFIVKFIGYTETMKGKEYIEQYYTEKELFKAIQKCSEENIKYAVYMSECVLDLS